MVKFSGGNMDRTVRKEFWSYVSLNILGMLGLSCYILADTYFIAAKLGADGLTSLNLAISIYSFIHGTGLMIGIGGATKYAIYKSRRETKKGSQIFTAALIIGIIAGVILFMTGIFGSRQFAFLLGAKGAVIETTTIYLKTILCFAPCFICNNILIAFIRNDGNPKLAMAGMLCGSFSNILLDYVFLFPMDGGMFGAAFATGLAPVVSMAVLSAHFFRKKNEFYFQVKCKAARHIKEIVTLGVSAFINEISSGVVLIVFNLLILGLSGNTGVAAYGIVANLALVALSVFTGIAQGSQPLLSHYYGKGERQTVKQIYQNTVVLAGFLGVLLIVLAFGCTDALIRIFNSEGSEKLHDIAFTGLRLYFLGFPLAGINIVTASYQGAVEHAGSAFTISVVRGLAAVSVLAVLLSSLFGMTGIWLAFACAEATALLIFALLRFVSNKKPLPDLSK